MSIEDDEEGDLLSGSLFDPAEHRHEKCDACWSRAHRYCELPRRSGTGLELPPAKFRLCDLHAETLCTNDSRAIIRSIEGGLIHG